MTQLALDDYKANACRTPDFVKHDQKDCGCHNQLILPILCLQRGFLDFSVILDTYLL
jgi:hypothetical protein